MLRVRLLGELEAVAGGRPIDPPASSRARALLAWLAMHPGEHARGAVAARFWPDVLDSSARASLRSSAWALRRALGAEATRAGGEPGADRPALRDGPRRLRDPPGDRGARGGGRALPRPAARRPRRGLGARGPRRARRATRRGARPPRGERRSAARGGGLGAAAPGARPARRGGRPRPHAPAHGGGRPVRGARGRRPPRPAAAHDARPCAVRGDPGARRGRRAEATVARRPRRPRTPGTVALVGRAAELAALEALWAECLAGRGALAMLERRGRDRQDPARGGDARARPGGGGVRCGVRRARPRGRHPRSSCGRSCSPHLAGALDPPEEAATWPEELARLAPALPRRLGRRGRGGRRPGRPRPRPALRGGGRAHGARHGRAAARPRLRRRPPRRRDRASIFSPTSPAASRVLPVLLVLTRRGVPRRDAVDGLLALRPRAGRRVRRDRCRAAAPCGGGAARRRRWPRWARSRASGWSPRPTATPCWRSRAPAPPSAGTAGRPPRCARPSVPQWAGSPRGRAGRRSSPRSPGRDLDRAELLALAEPGSVAEALDSGLFRSAAGRFGYRHALLRDAVRADLDDGRLGELHEMLGTAARTRPAEAARHLELAGRPELAVGRLLAAAADARRATAVEAAVGFLRRAVELAPDDPEPRLELAEAAARAGRPRDGRRASSTERSRGSPAGERSRRAAAHARAARWFRGSLCDPAAAGDAARRGLEALDLAAPDARDLRAELLGVRAWSEVTVTGADAAAGSLRELEALTVEADADPAPRPRHGPGLRRARPRPTRRGRASCWSAWATSGDRIGRADMAYGGWAQCRARGGRGGSAGASARARRARACAARAAPR